MTPEARAGLLALTAALPDGLAVPVPREWLLELLTGAGEPPGPAQAPADLTAVQVAERFGRQASTVRMWLERGMFPGAYKFMGGREWRVPAGSLVAFEAAQREGLPGTQVQAPGKPIDLGAWRKAS